MSPSERGSEALRPGTNRGQLNQMRTSDFDFDLPDELIAQFPLAQRDQSRLLVLDRGSGQAAHRRFTDLLEYLHENDLLVLNNSRVIRARLRGVNARSSGRFELLLVEENGPNDWWAMVKPGKRARVGTRMILTNRRGQAASVSAQVIETNPEGHRRFIFEGTPNILDELEALGEVPLPPYIRRGTAATDLEQYQTVFAETPGSVAAPTAGLHFTSEFLQTLTSRGISLCDVTLHVGLGTFAPVKAEHLEVHVMHAERYEISSKAAEQINGAKRRCSRVVAVGTTALRTLESAVKGASNEVAAGRGRTRLFVRPPHKFRVVDALLTNFHLPCSTLLMLVSAFAAPGETRGRELVLNAYAEAIRERYRFFSYGDAMFIQ